MQITYRAENGIRYTIQTYRGLRELEPEIKPDLTLWNATQRRKMGVGHDGRRWKNRYGEGLSDADADPS